MCENIAASIIGGVILLIAERILEYAIRKNHKKARMNKMSKGITSTFSDHKKNKKWYMVSSGIAWLSGCVSVFAIRWLGVWSVVFIAIALVGLFGMTVFANRMSDMLDEVLNADSELVPNNQATDSDDSPNE